jgi:hypothetical protein
VSAEVRIAIAGWNMMGGELNWTALPIVAGLLGVKDPEAFIAGLTGIRDGYREQERNRGE